MTKTNQIRLALLSATALFTATSANAQVADSWEINGEVIVSAANTGATTTLDPVTPAAVLGIEEAAIADGFRNSISGSTVGASASSAFTSVNNSGTGGDTILAINGGVTVAAGNVSAVTNTNDVVTSATISAGSANSISLAAVGSSASVSASTTTTSVGGADTSELEFGYTAGLLTISSGDAEGAVEVEGGSTIGGNDAAVVLTLDTGFNAPLIEGGFGNSISVAGVGSSASASFNATVSGASDITVAGFTLNEGAVISAANSENGTVNVGLSDAGFVTPAISEGNANSISAAAVGSSASFSLASSTYDSGLITEFNATVEGDIQVDSFNSGAVALSGDGADATAQTVINEASIGVGNGNSISASAVGASGSVSYANTVFSGENGALGGAVTINGAITVLSTNVADISNTTDLTTGGLIEGGSRNSISIAGVGSSASQALSVTDFAGVAATGVASTINGDITLTSLNTGAIAVSGGLQLPAIDGGFSNSISAAAVGASASQSVSRTVLLQQ